MIPELIHTFETSVKFIEKLVDDLSEEQMVEQPTKVPNHAAWTLGHVIFSCQGMALELGTDTWLPENWESNFGYGSTPHSTLELYPRKSELLTLLGEASQRLRQTLDKLDTSDLDQSLPDEMFPTMGHLLLQVVIAHTAYHAGQLAVWRKAIGKPSVGIFV